MAAFFDPAAYIEVANCNASFFTDTLDGDLTFYTGTSNQRVLFGTQVNTPSLLALDGATFTASRNAVFSSNLLVDGSLQLARPIVLAGLQIGRSPLPGSPLNVSVQPPFSSVTGLSNDAFGMQMMIPSSNGQDSFRFLAVSNTPAAGFVRTELARLTEGGNLGVGTGSNAAPAERLSIGSADGPAGPGAPAALSLTGGGGKVVLTTGSSNLGVGFAAGAGAALTALLHVGGTGRFDGALALCNGVVTTSLCNPGPGGTWAASLSATALATPAFSNVGATLHVAQLSNATTLFSPTVAFGAALAGPGLVAGPAAGPGGAAGAQTGSLCNANAAYLGGAVSLGGALSVPAAGLAACNATLYTTTHSNSGALWAGSVATPSLAVAGPAAVTGALAVGGALSAAGFSNTAATGPGAVVVSPTLVATTAVLAPYVSCVTLSNTGVLQAGAVVTPGFSNGGAGGATLFSATHSNAGALWTGTLATPSLTVAGPAFVTGALAITGGISAAGFSNTAATGPGAVVVSPTLVATAAVLSPYVSCDTLSNTGALQTRTLVTPGFSNGGAGGATLFSATHSNAGALWTGSLATPACSNAPGGGGGGGSTLYTVALSNGGALSSATVVATAALVTPACSNGGAGGATLFVAQLCNATTLWTAGALAYGDRVLGPGLTAGPAAGPAGAAGVQTASLCNVNAAYLGGAVTLGGPLTAAVAGALAACNATLYTTTLSNSGALAVTGALVASGGLAVPAAGAAAGVALASTTPGGGSVTLTATGAPPALSLSLGTAGLVAMSVTARMYDALDGAAHLPLSASNAGAFKAWLARETSTSTSWWAASAAPSYGVVSSAVYNAATATSNAYGGAVLLPDGSVIMVPARAVSVTVFVPATNQLNMLTGDVDPPGGASPAYGGGVLLPDSRVVFAPRYATSVGIFRPSSINGFSALAVGAGLLAGNDDYHGAVLVPDGRVVFAPVNATRVATLSTSYAGASAVDTFAPVASTSGVNPAGGAAYRGCVLLPDGRVVFVPHNALNVGVFDPATNAFTLAAAAGGSASPPGSRAFFGGALLPDGRVAFAPHYATGVGIFDPTAGTYTTAAAGQAPGGGAYCGAVLLPDGRVVFVPHGAAAVATFAPATGALTATAAACVPATGSFSGGVLLPDGRVLLVPCTSVNVAVFNTFVQPSHALCYHPCFNRF
jgi:hypothetical protein